MAVYVLTDVTTHVGSYDMTTDMNEVSLKVEVDDQENTTFGSGGWRSRLGGLRNVSADLNGFWQSGTTAIDPNAFNNLGVGGEVVTISPTGVAADTAFSWQAGRFSYEMFGDLGEVTPFSLNMLSTDGVGVVRGQLAKAKGNVSATGALGSVLNLGAVGASGYLYASLHVFSAGTTITVQVQSDDNSGMTTPTTRGTFTGVTSAGGNWLTRVAGPITDTYWRMNVSAITGTFSVAGFIAVQ